MLETMNFFSNVYYEDSNKEAIFKKVTDICKENNFLNIGIIVDSGVYSSDTYKEFEIFLTNNGLNLTWVYKDTPAIEPTYDLVDDISFTCKQHILDALFGIGGGSIMDIAKGLGIFYKNGGKSIDYRGMNKVKVEGLPVILFPTTAGTGSEVTKTASFIDTKSQTKLGINGKYVNCFCAFLIPQFLYSCPKMVLYSSILDALVHAYEAITSKASNSVSKDFGMLALNKIRNASKNDNLGGELMLGSYYAGLAMSIAGGGISSGVSYPLGVHYKIPHGVAGGIFLPKVYEYSNLCLEPLQSVLKLISLDEIKKKYFSNMNESDITFLTNITLEQRKQNMELNSFNVDFNILYNIIKESLL